VRAPPAHKRAVSNLTHSLSHYLIYLYTYTYTRIHIYIHIYTITYMALNIYILYMYTHQTEDEIFEQYRILW